MKSMKIVIACDSFKGTLSSRRAAEVIAGGVCEVFPSAEICSFLTADGGEGTVEAVIESAGGEYVDVSVHDPLGRAVAARYGLTPAGEAVIEMAAASGITLVTAEERDPRRASTYGTGELIRAALDRGCRSFILGIGGSATNDGGAGMARALGARFLDSDGDELPDGGAALADLARIDMSGFDPRIKDAVFTVACDVTNPLCGADGASAVYGPQKGADSDAIRELDAALANYAAVIARDLGLEVRDLPGAGAAGGLGAGLMAFCGASVRSGAELVLESSGICDALDGAALLITGEGRLDSSTACGKAPTGAARIAARHGVPVLALGAQLGAGWETLYNSGIDAVEASVARLMSYDEAVQNTEKLLHYAAVRAMRLIKLGTEM